MEEFFDVEFMLGKKNKNCFIVCVKAEAVCRVWTDDEYMAIEIAKDKIFTDFDVENKDWTAYEFNEYCRIFGEPVEMTER